MKNTQIIKSIISCRDKNIYMSDSIALKSMDRRTCIFLWVLPIVILIFIQLLVLVLYGNFIVQMSAYFFNAVPDNYTMGEGTIVSVNKYHRGCTGKIRVYYDPFITHVYVKDPNLSCFSSEGDTVRFIYPNDASIKILITDGHADFTLLYIFFAFCILCYGPFLLKIYYLVRIRIRYLNTVKSQRICPLRLKLERYKNFYERNDDARSQLSMITELGSDKKKLWLFVQKDQLCFSESRFETLAIHTGLCNQNVSKVCHIYGIRENELRKFAGLPTVSTSGKERERRIYFAGPWIKPDECPKENMDIWFTEGGSYDYFLTPSDVNGFDKLFGKHAEKKTYTSKKQHTLRS